MEDNVYQLEVKRANVVLGSGQEINETIWGTIIGDISRQKDLQTELDNIKGSIPDITKINQDINHLKEEKADKSEIPDTSGFASKSELQLKADKEELSKFALKTQIPDTSNLATKNELSSYLNGKADKSNVYTKDEIDNKLSISTGAVWGSITGSISQQADLQKELASIKDSIPNLSGIKEDISNLKSGKADKTEITNLSTKKEVTDGLATKADKSEIPNISGLATKTELSSSLNGLNQQITLKANKVDVYTRTEIDSIFGWTEID
jgi:hypothetical protein